MGKVKELTGQRFGRLVVSAFAGMSPKPNGRSRALWTCKCDCGSTVSVDGNSLQTGNTSSCGCLRREQLSARNASRGTGAKRHPLYVTWKDMKARCQSQSDPEYHNYGGRGITICDRWLDFWAFVSDVGPRPKGMTLERIDTDGDYVPSNCRWATASEQSRNKRTNRYLSHGGVSLCITDWAKRTGINKTVIRLRLARGWSVQDALTKPPDRRNRINHRA